MHPAVRMQRRVVAASNGGLRVQAGEVAQAVVGLRDEFDGKLERGLTYGDTLRITRALAHGRHTVAVPEVANTGALACSRAGVNDLIADLHRIGVTGTPLDDPEEAARHRVGVVPARRALVVRAQHRYEDVLTTAVRQSLQGSLHRKVTVGEAISASHSAVSDHSGSVRRVLITETSASYNAGRQSALIAVARTHPHLMQRWTELIDGKGRPLDKKVADDSFAMHGQLVKVGQPFLIPSDPRIASILHGKRVFYPPMRPADRAVLQPWIDKA